MYLDQHYSIKLTIGLIVPALEAELQLYCIPNMFLNAYVYML